MKINLYKKIQHNVSKMKEFIVKYFKTVNFLIPLLILTSCGMMPNFLQTAEDIIDDDAITIKVSRESLGRNTNVTAYVELDNKQTQK